MIDALKPYLARSFGLHVAALAAFILLAPRALMKADKVYMIDFVGGAATIQSVGQTAKTQRADAAPQHPTPQVDPDSIMPKGGRGRFALPRPSLLKGWTEPKILPRAAPKEPEISAAWPGVATDLSNFPYPWYISQIRQMLWATWQKYRPASSGEGVVVFVIMRNGASTDLRMESSSGDIDFDGAAIKSVQAAAPFPALPSDFAELFLKVHLTLKSEASWR